MNTSNESVSRPEFHPSAETSTIVQWRTRQAEHQAELGRIIAEDPNLHRIQVLLDNPPVFEEGGDIIEHSQRKSAYDAALFGEIISAIPDIIGNAPTAPHELHEVFGIMTISPGLVNGAIAQARAEELIYRIDDETGSTIVRVPEALSGSKVTP